VGNGSSDPDANSSFDLGWDDRATPVESPPASPPPSSTERSSREDVRDIPFDLLACMAANDFARLALPGKTPAESFAWFLGIDSPEEAAWREAALMLAPHPTLSRFNTRFERSIFVGTVLDEVHLWEVSTYNDHEELIYLNTLCLPGLANMELLPQAGNGIRLLFELPCRDQPSLLIPLETDGANTSVMTRGEQPYCLTGECFLCHTYDCVKQCIAREEFRKPMYEPSDERSTQPVMDPALFEDPFAKLTTVSSGDPHYWGFVRQTSTPAGGPESYATLATNGVIFGHQDYNTSQVRLRLATSTDNVETFGKEFVPKSHELNFTMPGPFISPGPILKLQLKQLTPVQGLDLAVFAQVSSGIDEPCPETCPGACVCPMPGLRLSRIASHPLSGDLDMDDDEIFAS
tara:strand:- start:346 stop:1557 length:1212 start_codon:yes stop_codon:yes gene_type:complete